jgi:hypothetical protein
MFHRAQGGAFLENRRCAGSGIFIFRRDAAGVMSNFCYIKDATSKNSHARRPPPMMMMIGSVGMTR